MIYRRRFEWIEYPAEDPGNLLYVWNAEHAGFRARVLVNPTGAELREETKLFVDSNNSDIDAHDAYWQAVAYRVSEWNLAFEDQDGAVTDVPAPAQRWESFLDIEIDLAMWLRTAIHWAHRGKVWEALQRPILPDAVGTTDTTPKAETAPSNLQTPSTSDSTD